jgi:flavocytochrome c
MAEVDVVVVGSGGAGHCAAIMAREGGADVMMLEAGSRWGGSTALSGGVFYAAGTSVQRAAGISDTPDALYEHYMAVNHWLLEAAIVRRYCDEACRTIEWLIGLGVEYDPKDLYCSGIESVRRGHLPRGFGLEYFSALHNRASSLGVEMVRNTRVDKLLTDARGRVNGVRAGGEELRARAVILACGGLGANAALLREYYPDAVQHGEWHVYLGPDTNRGDAIKLGLDVGAVVAASTVNRGMVALAPRFDNREAEGFLPTWLLFVNQEGRRFMSETAPYAVAGDIVNMQTHQHCYAIFDQYVFMNANGKGWKDKQDMPGTLAPNWEHELFERMLAKGRIVRADTLEDLARRISVHPGALKNNVDRYNRFVDEGRDGQFFKDMTGTVAIRTPPFYATEVRAGTYAHTAVGLQIDADARVYNASDEPIPSLYAAGEAAGGVQGKYLGGGNAIGPPAVFGRIAGRNAAREIKERGP